MSQAILDQLCAQQPACKTVLFADVATGVALIADSRSNLNRGMQSALCTEAEELLGNQKRPAAFCETTATYAYAKTKGEVKVFLRNPAAPSDALCCICEPSIDVEVFMSAAQDALAQISGADA